MHAAAGQGGTQGRRIGIEGTQADMATVQFRFYEELNDFLSRDRQGHSFCYATAENATVKQAIEALGVPHTEVDLVLVNGESVYFSRRLDDGDRISVYPQFESLDISPLVKLRERPLRRPRFVADAHLGALAKYLRMLGFDTVYRNDYTDDDVVRLSLQERRITLTRDRALLMRRDITHGCFVRALRPPKQLEEVLARLDLYRTVEPFSRCMECNSPLQPVDKATIAHRLPPHVNRHYRRFAMCSGCQRIYWEGHHYKRMRAFIHSVQSWWSTS